MSGTAPIIRSWPTSSGGTTGPPRPTPTTFSGGTTGALGMYLNTEHGRTFAAPSDGHDGTGAAVVGGCGLTVMEGLGS